MDEFSKKVGDRIRELRKQKGYKAYEDLAYEADIPRAQWGRYEKGANLKVNSLKKVLDALGVTPAEFFSKGFE
jgi:transcriptional regulator with XRE-family HTH domain